MRAMLFRVGVSDPRTRHRSSRAQRGWLLAIYLPSASYTGGPKCGITIRVDGQSNVRTDASAGGNPF